VNYPELSTQYFPPVILASYLPDSKSTPYRFNHPLISRSDLFCFAINHLARVLIFTKTVLFKAKCIEFLDQSARCAVCLDPLF